MNCGKSDNPPRAIEQSQIKTKFGRGSFLSAYISQFSAAARHNTAVCETVPFIDRTSRKLRLRISDISVIDDKYRVFQAQSVHNPFAQQQIGKQ
jgi:hypothetical protein